MDAASLSERRGGSFFSVCLSCSPLGALIVAVLASARDSNLAARHMRLFASYIHAPVTPPTQIERTPDAIEERRAQK